MIAILRACAFGLVLLLTTASTTRATDQTIVLELGVGSVFMLDRPFETVLIGDPDVIDVHTQTDRSVILEPLNLGASTIIFLDQRKIAISNIRVLVSQRDSNQVPRAPDCVQV
jgi:Flp pilus assembly secretin CpaC